MWVSYGPAIHVFSRLKDYSQCSMIADILKMYVIKNKAGELTLLEIQTYYAAIIIKNVWS